MVEKLAGGIHYHLKANWCQAKGQANKEKGVTNGMCPNYSIDDKEAIYDNYVKRCNRTALDQTA